MKNIINKHVVNLELSKELKKRGTVSKTNYMMWMSNLKQSDYFLLERHAEPHLNEKDICAYLASELLDILPHRIVLPKGNQFYPFDSFVLKIKKSIIVKNNLDLLDREKHPSPVLLEEIEYQYLYSANYYCDSTEMCGEDAWLERKFFDNNISDENICNALAKLIIKIHDSKIFEFKKENKC